MKKTLVTALSLAVMTMTTSGPTFGQESLKAAVARDYDGYLSDLYLYFHKNPELSLQEHKTAARLAKELRAEGFEVTTGVGGTGIVAMMKNGDGPLVMMRADMDGLPVQEKSGLSYASVATQKDLITGNEVPVMHACTGRSPLKRRWPGIMTAICRICIYISIKILNSAYRNIKPLPGSRRNLGLKALRSPPGLVEPGLWR